jgi:hypothetical protein
MLRLLFSLIVVAYLPGALLLRAPVADRDRRAALDAEERVFWAVVLSVAWSSLVVLALAALRRYSVARLITVDLGVAIVLIAAFRQHLRYGPAARRVTRSALLPLASLALGGWLFFPAFPHVIGGKDPGTYVNEGVQIAQRGSLVVRDEVVSSLPRQVRDLFFPRHPSDQYYGTRFMGFFVQDPDRGTVVGQFPQLFPAWIAVGYDLDGLRGGLAATPVAALLGLLAVYFAGARLVGRGSAFLGTALLALNVATIWFAREPNSEVAAQVLIFAGALAYARAQVDGDRFFAPVAALLFGLLPFARIDGVVALVALGVAMVLQLFDLRRPRAAFLLPLAGLAVAAWAYWSALMSGYLQRIIVLVTNPRPVQIALLSAGAVTLVALVYASRAARSRALVRAIVRPGLIVAVVAAAIYAYFFRMPGGRLADYDARSLEAFTWYFPPLALAAAVAGFSLVTWRSFWRAPVLLVTLAAYAFFVFYKIQIVPVHFWAARRFVPVILPGASLMAGAAIAALVTVWPLAWRRWRIASLVAASAIVVFVAVPMLRAEVPLRDHVEYAGMLSRMEELAKRFGERDLVVVESRDTQSDVFVLALPLNYIWNRPVLVLPSPKPDKKQFRAFLDWAWLRYTNVYFLGGGGTDLVSRAIGIVPVFSDRFQVPEYESAKNAYPREVRRKEFDFGVYRFTPPTAQASTFALDIGQMDDVNVYRFHSKEAGEGRSYRWSRPRSTIVVPRDDAARSLTLWMSNGGRPEKAGPARVSVYLDDVLLGTVVVAPGFNPYSFAVAAGAVLPAGSTTDDAMLVRIENTTWKPRLLLGTPDDRDLGVMVSRIEVR